MKEVILTTIALPLLLALIIWFANFIKNFIKNWVHANILQPIKSIQNDVAYLKKETTIVQGYLMKRNGFGDYRRLEIEALEQDKTLEKLTKEEE